MDPTRVEAALSLEREARHVSRRAVLGMAGIGAAAAIGVDVFGSSLPAYGYTSVPFPMANPWTDRIVTCSFECHENRNPPSVNPGVDFDMPVGTILQAPHSGNLVIDQEGSLWQANITHSSGWKSELLHASGFIGANRAVSLNDAVAYSGGEPGAPGSGNADGPHVHWTLKAPGGAQQDPIPLVNTGAGAVPTPLAEDFELTDIIYFASSGTYTTNGVKTPAVTVATNSMWYQESVGAPLFKITDNYVGNLEYYGFLGARFSNANAARYVTTAALIGALIELRGESLQPTASMAPLRT